RSWPLLPPAAAPARTRSSTCGRFLRPPTSRAPGEPLWPSVICSFRLRLTSVFRDQLPLCPMTGLDFQFLARPERVLRDRGEVFLAILASLREIVFGLDVTETNWRSRSWTRLTASIPVSGLACWNRCTKWFWRTNWRSEACAQSSSRRFPLFIKARGL